MIFVNKGNEQSSFKNHCLRIKILILVVIFVLLGYGAHKLIRKLINPKASVNHLFLYFLAHFLSIFLLAFLVNFIVLHFSKYLFH